jgi:hypothetical protein
MLFYDESGEPDRLVKFADHEIRFWMQSQKGLTKAALNEVLLLRDSL